jgi:hypothetical protein
MFTEIDMIHAYHAGRTSMLEEIKGIITAPTIGTGAVDWVRNYEAEKEELKRDEQNYEAQMEAKEAEKETF